MKIAAAHRLQTWRASWRQLRASLRGGPGHRGAPTHHFDGERFANPGAPAGQSLRAVLRWWCTRRPAPWPRWREYAQLERLPEQLDDRQIAITLINHVSFLVQLRGLNLLIDPVYALRASPVQWAGPRRVHAPGVPFERLPRIDLVFVSHNHYDHLDLTALRRLALRFAPLFVTGLGNDAFLREQGIAQVRGLDWWQWLLWRDTQLLFTPAQHWSGRGPGGRNRTLWGGLWLARGERRVYFSGDTGYAPLFGELRQRLGRPDVALLPIGAYEPRWFMGPQHLNPQEAVRAHAELGARQSIACHFGCFRLGDEDIDAPVEALVRACEEQGMAARHFRVPRPGQTLIWRADAADDRSAGAGAQ